jgi:ankyrin repeat protein
MILWQIITGSQALKFWPRSNKQKNFPELEEMLGKFIASDNAIGLTPFLKNHPGAVDWEIAFGNNRETYLHQAVHREKFNAARVLLEHGAATDTLGIGGGTLLDEALSLVYANSRGRIEKEMRMADLLLSYGADLEQRNAQNRTPLQQACWMGKPAAATYLVTRGADQHAAGASLLFDAVKGYGDRAPIISYVLSLKPDINAANAEGQTALFYVQDEKAAALLVEAGADPNHRARDGRRPWDLRVDEGLGDFLRARGEAGKASARAVFTANANAAGAEEAAPRPVLAEGTHLI